MQLTYQLTVADFRSALCAYRNRSPLRNCLRWIAFALLLVAGVSVVALLILSSDSRLLSKVWPSFLLVFVWIALLVSMPYFSARHQFRGSPAAHAPITLDVDDSGMRFRSQYSDSTMAWPTFVRWIEQKNVFACFTSPRIFMVIPKRAFSSEQLGQFRDMLQRNIGPAGARVALPKARGAAHCR